MIKLDKVSVMNFENAMRGARNPMNSWSKSDSHYCGCQDCHDCKQYGMERCTFYILGTNDLDLAKRLCKAGSDHRKFLRQIFVSVDITGPLYWFKEYDTYKVGTTANSTSTMHRIHSKEFAIDDFSYDRMSKFGLACLEKVVEELEVLRVNYVETKDKQYWEDIIQLLPSSYNQTRTCTMTYENLWNMYNARKSHKLTEWHTFCEWVEGLPYMKEFMGVE